jgi:hypothetical protein
MLAAPEISIESVHLFGFATNAAQAKSLNYQARGNSPIE